MLELTALFNEKGKVTHTLKLQRKLKFCSTSCTTEEKRREKERKHPWRFKGKTSTRAFLTQLTHKTLKRRLRCNHVRTTRAALSVAASSKLVQPPFAWLRDQGLGPTAGARSLARFASRLSSSWRKRNFFFCPSLRAIKTSLFGKSGKRFQNLLNGCRREASFLYDMHHKFVDKLYDFAKN